jgi:hypothetical protein
MQSINLNLQQYHGYKTWTCGKIQTYHFDLTGLQNPKKAAEKRELPMLWFDEESKMPMHE